MIWRVNDRRQAHNHLFRPPCHDINCASKKNQCVSCSATLHHLSVEQKTISHFDFPAKKLTTNVFCYVFKIISNILWQHKLDIYSQLFLIENVLERSKFQLQQFKCNIEIHTTKNCIFYMHLLNLVLPIVHNLCLYQYSPTPTSLTVYQVQQDTPLSKSFPIASLHTHYLSLSSSPSLMLFYWRVLHFQVSNNPLFCIK